MSAYETHTNGNGPRAGMVIRRLDGRDADALLHLASLDSAPTPTGEWLGAEVEGRLLAAASLDGQDTIADPFSRTSELRELLELRVGQLRGRTAHGARRIARRRATLAGSHPGGGGRLLRLPIRPY